MQSATRAVCITTLAPNCQGVVMSCAQSADCSGLPCCLLGATLALGACSVPEPAGGTEATCAKDCANQGVQLCQLDSDCFPSGSCRPARWNGVDVGFCSM